MPSADEHFSTNAKAPGKFKSSLTNSGIDDWFRTASKYNPIRRNEYWKKPINFITNKLIMRLTIVISKGEEFYIGTTKEIPSVLSQGITIEETKENVLDALELYLEDMQSEANDENKVCESYLNIGF